jgi:hypothetical protein
MNIFKSHALHVRLENDLKQVKSTTESMQSEYGITHVKQFADNLRWEMMKNLYGDVANEVEQLSNRHPDSDIEDLIKFYNFKTNVKVESAKDFNTRMAESVVDEDVCAQVRVYTDDYFIEIDDNGKLSLTVENESWSEPETSLEAMEITLFGFYNTNNGG